MDIVVFTQYLKYDKIIWIGACAFEGCKSLKRIVLPKGIECVEWRAFHDCENLTIYCKDEEKPKEWEDEWDLGVKKVVWGYKGE
ncbi:MAG: leucine-rich repeat domain-containing protein [Clostridia bacterium]|nr:leucine-rich repeat domain-containing protein [Clostridia bacterium]